jgi:biofilm PGA synthesis lipoprotein PgaB
LKHGVNLLLTLCFVWAVCGCQPPDAKTAAVVYSPSSDQTAVAQTQPSFDICFKSLDQRVPVIMYHDVVKRRGRGTVWFDATVDEFTDQMAEIQSRGYTPVSLDQLHDHLIKGIDLPPKAIVITFDDNYQGFYDYAWPILKEKNFPAAMFVHTGYVGKTTGRAHMSWGTLKKLCEEPLFTVGSHTITHPDLTTLTPEEVEQELTQSKADLEQHLGRTINYFAYPDGKNNADVQAAVKNAGYTMAVSMENGPAEQSPNIECVDRYVQTRLTRAMDDADLARLGSIGEFSGPIKDGPVAYREQVIDGKGLAIVTGGTPVSVTSDTREGVLDFMKRTPGAVAGINGTFFDMAAIEATDNKLVGPCKTADGAAVIPDVEPWRWPKIRNRPVIMWGPTQAAIVSYDPPLMNDDSAYRQFMPDLTDAFLGGAWLVHAGKAIPADQMEIFASKDIEDPRRRAGFGFMPDGTVFAAAAKDSVSSSQFAEMLVQAGAQEAILLDSGFSTSLVYGDKVMASGHSTKTTPSRPVPHAIVFKGTLDPASQAVAAAAIPATDPVVVERTAIRTRRHRRRHRQVAADKSAVSTTPPSASPDAAPSGPPPDAPSTSPPPTSAPSSTPPTDSPPPPR